MKQVNIPSGVELKALRKKYKLSQGDLCEIMEMSRKSYPMIRKYERGEQDIIDYRSWLKLGEYLKNKE